MDKWFTTQATSRLPGTLERVKALMQHRAYDAQNPNRIRSLVGAFCHANPIHFHSMSGKGYQFLADRVLQHDQENPQIAAHMLGAFSRWRKFPTAHQSLMSAELERIFNFPHLSKDSREVTAKILGRT
jgi:aminopeptidase N